MLCDWCVFFTQFYNYNLYVLENRLDNSLDQLEQSELNQITLLNGNLVLENSLLQVRKIDSIIIYNILDFDVIVLYTFILLYIIIHIEQNNHVFRQYGVLWS